MHLVSTGKSTILSDFADLGSKSVYQHVNSESTDFQFYSRQRIFVEVNKKSGIEILRIKELAEQKMEIQRVRKLKFENVFCVACAKQSNEEMAMGLSNGQVKLYNYKNLEFTHRFNAENIRNSVLYLDYNGSDEYISSVYENGQINIFGIKTKAKIDTVNLDGNSTLARFHPTKRFCLSVASYKGAVTVYDIQTKRKLFHSLDAHASPCRDLCMSAATPDVLISVGFDCLINVFDTRRKTQPVQLRYCHPLSTVALSECGNFFCAGNLKGELITYDMRNLKVFLATKKVHDCAVTRVAFLPVESDHSVSSFISTGNQTATNAGGEFSQLERNPSGEMRKSIAANLIADAATRGHRDSFCDFLDFQANKGLEKISSRFTTRRDSYDCWDALQRKPSTEENPSLFPIGSGLSSIGSANNSVVASPCDSFDGKLHSSKHPGEEATVTAAPLRDRSNNSLAQGFTGKLVQIQEEQSTQNTSSGSDKENPPIDLEFATRLQILPADRNSTPNRSDRRSGRPVMEVAPAKPNQVSNDVAVSSAEISQLREEMNTRFHQLESEMKFQMETNKWQIFTQNFNLWSQQNENNEAISDALGILLQTDPFVNEFLRLKEENEMLKMKLSEQLKK